MTLSSAQVDALLAPLDPQRVRQVQGNSHLEAWDIRRHLLRVFGWGGWDFTVLSCDVISERSHPSPKDEKKTVHSIVYRVTARLTIKDPSGEVLAHFDDGATGDAINQPSLGDAHDMALKTAMSQALKRCAVNLGDRFGLSLYNGGKAGATVGATLGNPSTVDHPAEEEVRGGELSPPEAPAEGGTEQQQNQSTATSTEADTNKSAAGPATSGAASPRRATGDRPALGAVKGGAK